MIYEDDSITVNKEPYKDPMKDYKGKSIRQQIEEADHKMVYDGVITEEILIDFLEDLNKTDTRRYIDPTEYMSQKQKQQFNSYVQESIKKAKEDGY